MTTAEEIQAPLIEDNGLKQLSAWHCHTVLPTVAIYRHKIHCPTVKKMKPECMLAVWQAFPCAWAGSLNGEFQIPMKIGVQGIFCRRSRVSVFCGVEGRRPKNVRFLEEILVLKAAFSLIQGVIRALERRAPDCTKFEIWEKNEGWREKEGGGVWAPRNLYGAFACFLTYFLKLSCTYAGCQPPGQCTPLLHLGRGSHDSAWRCCELTISTSSKQMEACTGL